MKQRLLALLRVSERPDPPPGAGESPETFRPTRGFLYYSILLWFPKQVAAFIGLMFSLAFFGGLDRASSSVAENVPFNDLRMALAERHVGFSWLDFDLLSVIAFFEALAVVAFVAQLLFTGLLLKTSWELRWYMIGERSLRIRHGLWTVREQTMTIANIQNMVVRQGPLQRLFGFSDLEVRTAGGGGGSGDNDAQQKDSFHIGRFRGLVDAPALRDKLRRRLKVVKGEAAEDPRVPGDPPPDTANAVRDAALTLLGEARALRRALN